jgi:hypothetical protein
MPSSTPASANCAPTDAAELLRALEEVDLALSQLREHALGDLLGRVRIDPNATTIDAPYSSATGTNDPSAQGAVRRS